MEVVCLLDSTIGLQHSEDMNTLPALQSAAAAAAGSSRLQQHSAKHTHMPVMTSSQPSRCLPSTRCSAEPLQQVVSCGVPISSYSSDQALEAVSGKSFGCTMCGKCCTLSDDAEVWVNEKEVAGMAAVLGITQEAVIADYMQPYQQVPGWFMLQSKQAQGPWPCEQQPSSSSSSSTAGQEAREDEAQQQRQVGCSCLE